MLLVLQSTRKVARVGRALLPLVGARVVAASRSRRNVAVVFGVLLLAEQRLALLELRRARAAPVRVQLVT